MRAELRDSLEFLFPDSKSAPGPCRLRHLDVARGGTIATHVLVNGLAKGQTVDCSVKSAGRKVGSARWFLLVDVPVEANTALNIFTEPAKGPRNPHVIRRAPFRVYDAMQPIGGRFSAPAPTACVRLHIPVNRAERPGRRGYDLRVTSGGAREDLRLDVDVHRAVVPGTGRDSLPYTNWFRLDHMASSHGLKPWSEAHWKMIGRYAALMAHARQNVFEIPLGVIFKRTARGPVLLTDRLRRLVKTFTRAGLYFIEGGHVAGRTRGKWTATTLSLSSGGGLATSPEGNAELAKICGQLMAEIDRNGWRNRWLQHVSDEPAGAVAADYRILSGMVHKYMPGIPLLDATMDTRLAGSVDIWVPLNNEFQKNKADFDRVRALGDHVWFYTCCQPGGRWLNRLLDMELLRPALYGWGMALFDLEGFLHWGFNYYSSKKDPFKKSVEFHRNGLHFPAGDSNIVYPGKGEPWSGLRLEAQREGFEDYELLKRLKAKRPALANSIIRSALRGFDRYTKDVRVFRAARKRLLQAS